MALSSGRANVSRPSKSASAGEASMSDTLRHIDSSNDDQQPPDAPVNDASEPESIIGDRRAGARDLLLVTLTLGSGFVEAISYVGLGHVFSVAQTGNMAMLGVRLSGNAGPNLLRTVAALLGFGAGALVGGLIVRRLQGRAADARVVWSRGVTLAVVAGLVLQALFLGLWLGVGGHPSGEGADVLITISAGAMGAQTTAVGSLGVRAVFTTAITATWGMLMGDLSGWAQSRGERRRLAAVLVALIVGALFGGLLMSAARDWAPVFPLAVSALVAAAAALVFHRARPERRRRDGHIGTRDHKRPVSTGA
jgi:uncharacterized membrane protein YoaK (UPF0700 family)